MESEQISGVILGWKRPAHLTRILASWDAGGIVGDAIVWNNNPACPFHHPTARVINANQDMGLYTRFAAACLANQNCVLFQDDDLQLPIDSLQTLFDAWKSDPEVIHGVFGRAPKPDGSYAQNLTGDRFAPIVLSRAFLVHRRYCARFFQFAHEFDEIQKQGKPPGNGEDVLFSYLVRSLAGRLNRIHRVTVDELPAPHAIHGRDWRGHVAHRTRLLHACEAWLEGSSANLVARSAKRVRGR